MACTFTALVTSDGWPQSPPRLGIDSRRFQDFDMANRSQIYKYKGDRCGVCGKSVKEVLERYGTINRMFELNHIDPSKKHPKYDNVIRRVINSEQLDEIDKCVLLCRDCHGIQQAQNINGELSLKVQVARRTCDQRFKGQIIMDFKDKTATFLTDEPVMVIPYMVQIGARKPILRFGKELSDSLLLSYMRDIFKIRNLTVRSLQGETLLQMTPGDGCTAKIMQRVEFPVMRLELGDSGATSLWVRNGMALTPDGEVINRGSIRYTARIVQSFLDGPLK